MPFQYKTPENARKRKKYTKKELESAIDEIKEGASIRKISIKYGIDRSTLRRYKLDENKFHKFEDKDSQYKASQVFTIAEEKLLVNYSRQPGKTKILTMTPEKENCNSENLTETQIQEISDPNNNKCGNDTNSKNKGTETEAYNVIRRQRIGSIKKRILEPSDTENDANYSIKKIRKTRGKTKGKKNVKVKQDVKQKYKKTKLKKTKKECQNKKHDSETESDNEDVPYADSSTNDDVEDNPDTTDRWYCFVCQTDDVMTMRLCLICRRYVHELCVGLTEDIDDFICHECDQK